MRTKVILKICCYAAGALLLFPLLAIHLVPSSRIEEALVRGLERQGYAFRADGFRKSFPLGIKAKNAQLGDRRGVLLKLDRASARVKILPLLIGRVAVDLRGRIGKGEFRLGYQPRSGALSIHGSGIRLEDIPFFPTATGAHVKGGLFVEGSFSGKGSRMRGELKLDARNTEVSSIKVGEMPLPDASYSSVRGMFRVAEGKGRLESLTFQGDGIYSRLSGTLPVSGQLANAPLDLTLELMPKPEFLERQKFVFMLLSRYQASPGSYRIPVKGVLTKPVIQ